MAIKKKVAKKAEDEKSETVEPKKEIKTVGSYFVGSEKDVDFISSGCALLDKALGGGWPVGRVVNIVGDKSSGKTLLAIEASANFALKFPKNKIWYNEAESAFDKGYAQALGMPVSRITFVRDKDPEACTTVEGLAAHIERCCEDNKGKNGMYIMDSLDALSDAAELGRSMEDGSYGANKAKKLSEFFRRSIRKLEDAGITLIVISQIRDKIGVTFGKKTSRSGGKALDFYCSIVLYLHEIGKKKKTINKVERPIGVQVKAKTEKNKVGLPFRECEFPIIFGYGVDSIEASLEWLKTIDGLEALGINPKSINRTLKKVEAMEEEEFLAFSKVVDDEVSKQWDRIEIGFLPKRRKY